MPALTALSRDGERQRADHLRDRIEAMAVQLAEAEAEGAASDVEMANLTANPFRFRRAFGSIRGRAGPGSDCHRRLSGACNPRSRFAQHEQG
jgi:hypothetical protein